MPSSSIPSSQKGFPTKDDRAEAQRYFIMLLLTYVVVKVAPPFGFMQVIAALVAAYLIINLGVYVLTRVFLLTTYTLERRTQKKPRCVQHLKES